VVRFLSLGTFLCFPVYTTAAFCVVGMCYKHPSDSMYHFPIFPSSLHSLPLYT